MTSKAHNNTYLDWMIMGFARHLDGGNPLRVAIEYEGPTYFDLPDKQCRLKVEIHDGSTIPNSTSFPSLYHTRIEVQAP